MRMIGAALMALATAGANAYPIDIENHARWVVLDGMPLLASGKPIQPEVTNLRTSDIATQPILISAVCGTLDFHNTTTASPTSSCSTAWTTMARRPWSDSLSFTAGCPPETSVPAMRPPCSSVVRTKALR